MSIMWKETSQPKRVLATYQTGPSKKYKFTEDNEKERRE